MSKDELDEFLSDGQEPAPDPIAVAPEPEAAKEVAAETEPVEQELVEETDPADGSPRLVPIKALQAERQGRQDWKEKALRMEGELAAIKAQMEAAAKAPPPAPPQSQDSGQVQPMPNPIEDPAGYAARIQFDAFNGRLNMSERALRAEMNNNGDIDAKLALFKEAAEINPHLGSMLQLQQDPVRWAFDQGVKIEADRAKAGQRDAMLKEIGEDPAAYRERIKQELVAEMQQQQPQAPAGRQPPPAPQFQSLAGSRSVQSRGAPVPNEVPLEELFTNFG